MERPSRRSATQSSTHANGDSSSSSSRRRRREASMRSNSKDNASASQSDGDAETDSSSVAAMETGSSVTRSSKKLQSQQRDPKKKDDGNPASSGHDDVDGDDEHEEEEGDDDLDLSSSESHGSHANGANGMNKRERSLSNVSTTSSSSSIASDHNEEDRLTMQLEKLKELEKKKKMVEDGTLAEYCRRVTEFKEERNRLMETAEWHKSLQLKNSQDLYGFEVQRAHNLWEQAKDVLKSEMLGQVDALLSSLKKELEELSKAEVSAGATTEPKPRSPSDVTESEGVSEKEELVPEKIKTKAPVASKRRKVGIEFPEQTIRLPLDDINTDLASILGSRQQTAAETTARLPQKTIDNFKSERRRLFCGKYILEDGDEVVISSPIIKEDYIGTISSITDDAVFVKLSSGQKVRIYLDLIEHKRCEVKPFLRGSAGMGSLQTTGWAECEPF